MAMGVSWALTDSSGTVQDSYAYDAFGTVTSATGTVPNPFGFDGAIYDATSGLLKMGARYYDPSVGRWMQQDPVFGGFRQNPQSLDRYAFASGNPINLVDMLGLCTVGDLAGHLIVGTGTLLVTLGAAASIPASGPFGILATVGGVLLTGDEFFNAGYCAAALFEHKPK